MLRPCLTVVLFKALLHHCFIYLLMHIAVVLEREKLYSLEFTTTNVRRKLSISFWEGKDLVTVMIAQCGREFPSVKSSVLLCSQLLSAISLEPKLSVVRVEVQTLLRHWTRLLIRKPDYSIHLDYYRCRSKS